MTKKKVGSMFVLLFIIMMIIPVMTSCGKEKQIVPSDNLKGTGEVLQMKEVLQWDTTHTPMLEQYEGATINDGKIYAYRFTEGGVDLSEFAKESMEMIASHVIPNVIEVISISVNSYEQICLWGSTEQGNTLWQINSDDSIDTIENIEVENLGKHAELKNFYADRNGYYYLWYSMSVPMSEVYEEGEGDFYVGDEVVYTQLDRIYVKDQQMNTIVYEQVPDSNFNKLLSLVFDEDGIPMLFAQDEEGYYVRRMRRANKEKYEATRLETNDLMDLSSVSNITYTEDGLMYISEGALYQYHMSNGKREKRLELAGAGIMEEDIIYLGMNGNTIEIIDNYQGFSHSEYTAITEGESHKTRLTLAVMELQPMLRKTISSFNRYQNEVTIDPIVYVEDWDFDGGREKLMMDIIQGKAPDLIQVDILDYDNLARIGAFSDLYLLMQEDGELAKEDFVTSILQAYEMDGHLYMIAPAFRLYTLLGAGSFVEGRNGLNAEEMIQFLESKGGSINSINGFSADESVLTTLCGFNMDSFIDWSEGSCNFTGKGFQQILDFAKEYKGKPYESFYEAIQSGTIRLRMEIINSVEDYRLASEMFGEKAQMIGYPTERGNGSAAILGGGNIAINAKSAHQKEAWEFIKYFIQNGADGTSFPIMREQFDAYLNESMIEEEVIENGVSSKVLKISYREPNIADIQVSKCDPEDVEAIREVVNNISEKFQYHTEIQNIIEEEAAAYFSNQKEIEEVCEIIQNRVQLYLSES